jgi:hypothetical protein
MTKLLDQLLLDRSGPATATVGMVSLPLPQDASEAIRPDHSRCGTQPVAWWVRHQTPRRVMAFVVDDAGVPEQLRLTTEKPAASPSAPKWKIEARITEERLDFVPHKFTNIESLRGVPAKDCTTVEYEMRLNYGDRNIALQFGATGPKGGPYYWQNVQVDRLWQNAAVQAVRVGGVIYNEDTYLWADVFLLLFSNGVAHAAAHFVNTKLHIKGYEFFGLPVIRFASEKLHKLDAHLPKDGAMFDAGAFKLNLADSAHLASVAQPGSLISDGKSLLWKPVSRTFNPQLEDAPPTEWPIGFARTFRFQFSLSDAAPIIARYRAPNWWYAACGEPSPEACLPVQGQYHRVGELTSQYLQSLMTRGRFDAPSAGLGNDGDTGGGIMRNFYYHGCADCYEDALNYCYYWADLAVDHTDFTVHQWFGGWGWKTCAYSKFRDVLYGYLETGDPYLLDTAEMAAEAYWAWFRSNWPRCTIGRDAYEVSGWGMLWRYQRTEHARERSREFVRMISEVLDDRGSVGGQIGAGPHPGYLSSLYMTGVCMISFLEVADAELEEKNSAAIASMLPYLIKMEERFSRDDIELFPSEYKLPRKGWGPAGHATWAAMAMRIYTQLARLYPSERARCERGLARIPQHVPPTQEEYGRLGRVTNNLVNPLYHDALLLGARVNGDGIEIAPAVSPRSLPPLQVVSTPFGDLTVNATAQGNETRLSFRAGKEFSIDVVVAGRSVRTSSNGNCVV